jgi:hypothetical protein
MFAYIYRSVGALFLVGGLWILVYWMIRLGREQNLTLLNGLLVFLGSLVFIVIGTTMSFFTKATHPTDSGSDA